MKLLLILISLLLPNLSYALCTGTGPYTCSSMADLETMLESNSPSWSNGAVINVTAGTYTVSSQILFTGGKNFTLNGNGSTLLHGAGAAGSSMIRIFTVPGTGPTRFTGFTVDPNSTSSNFRGAVEFHGNSHQLRVDNNTFIIRGGTPIEFYEDVRGVVDHNVCTWTGTENGVCHYTHHNRWDRANDGTIDGSYGDASWATASTAGTEHALIFENNTYNYTPSGVNTYAAASDGWNGQRVVYRFNTNGCTVFHNHGTESAGRPRSGYMMEVYNNTYTAGTGCDIFTIADVRGGGAYIFGNTGTTTGGGVIQGTKVKVLRVPGAGLERSPFGVCGQAETAYPISSVTSSGTTATITFSSPVNNVIWNKWWTGAGETWITVSGAGQANYNGTFKVTVPAGSTHTTMTYTCSGACGASPATGTIHITSPWDQNSNSDGKHCLDQPGMGHGDYLGDDGIETPGNPTLPAGTQASPVAGWPNQALNPMFHVNNTVNGTPTAMVINAGVPAGLIVENQHFYSHNASFTGSTGIGTGLRSARPSTCTTGVLYWATDGGTNWRTDNGSGVDGGVDKCTSTNTWTNNWYVPYTYPHPLIALTGGGGGGSTASAVISVPSAGSTQSGGSTFAVNGTATPGSGSLSNVSVYIDGVLTCQDTVTPWSTWTCNATAPSSPGTYTLTAKATDAAGQGPASTGVSFTVPSPTVKKLRLR